ncbi:MAG: hypothetical protein A3G18_03325 [Rhodospirillales bacterium RIFCSPLOWO2_12_FULL_58_28]|nr:MAG: hypothetical protein A3H92_03270 [Rhodospirillales bacterium RIFCSPLOWO2_02_FULL_58_16]OHC77308.1 MAG: hypothetical protein A3G18_03325 [Rhodospirillales bacterium RIFCSPLOWO2_12_FULL_58_28]
MIASPSNALQFRSAIFASGFAVLIAGAGFPGLGMAQDSPSSSAPVRLAPPKAPPLSPAPQKPSPAAKQEAPAPGSSKASSPAAPSNLIEVDSLQTIDPDATGVLSEGKGGFGVDMWAGAGREMVFALLPQLPVAANSITMRELMRRLLLSSATPPQGDAAAAQGGGLMAIRARLLVDMGDLNGADRLIGATPDHARNNELVRIEADVRFLSNDNARACALAVDQITAGANDYWQKAFIFCQALAGEKEKASLGISILRELGEKDAVFLQLAGALINGEVVAVERLPDPSPMHLAMARAAKASLPMDVMSSNLPGILSAVAVNPSSSVDLRLNAAEKAEATGALHVDTLRQLYTDISFSDKEMANPLSKAEAESSPMSRALLYRASLTQTAPAAQAELLARALSLARQDGRYKSTARVFMPALLRVPPSPDLAWFAPEAARSLLAGGEHEAAGAWFSLLRSGAVLNDDSKAALKALMPIARLAGSVEAGDWTTDNLADWWETEKENDGARERATLLYSLFEALGEPVPDKIWDKLINGRERITVTAPLPALRHRLEKTAHGAAGERPGETVLISLLALGKDGLDKTDPIILRQALAGLYASGLKSEARMLAVEAALAADL